MAEATHNSENVIPGSSIERFTPNAKKNRISPIKEGYRSGQKRVPGRQPEVSE